jgi:hypothetical protein
MGPPTTWDGCADRRPAGRYGEGRLQMEGSPAPSSWWWWPLTRTKRSGSLSSITFPARRSCSSIAIATGRDRPFCPAPGHGRTETGVDALRIARFRHPALVTDETDSGEAMTFATYRLGFGTNTTKATAFSARVFQEVYWLPADAPLTATEGERVSRPGSWANVRFLPIVDSRPAESASAVVMSAFDCGFNRSMQQLVEIFRPVFRSLASCGAVRSTLWPPRRAWPA